MPDYSKGQIYMIYPLVEDADECDIYIGSTIQHLSVRMAGHRKDYNRRFCASHILFDKYGMINCKIELLYDFPCESKKELEREEGKNMRSRKCVNKKMAGRTKEETAEKTKQYYIDNKEQMNEYQQQYRIDNKEQINEYYIDNKEQINEKHKQYYINHKEQILEKQKEKLPCPICSKLITKSYMKKHMNNIH
tara:strand:- start:123 stop:698 length:576 start_codon:yes stop_codon:yes gene_type:complete